MYYEGLRRCLPRVDFLVVGGDFNSTLSATFDRSKHTAAGTHDSPGLRSVVEQWNLLDALASEMDACETEADVRDFIARTHTYTYADGEDRLATSRLHRYYVSTSRCLWVRGCTVLMAGGASDLEGVILRLADPRRDNTIRRRRKAYPPLPDQVEVMQEACRQVLLSADPATVASKPHGWDSLKTALRIRCLEVQ